MKITRFLCLCLALALVLGTALSLVGCSKYRLEMSNETESRTVLTVDGYDVPFEVLYSFYKNSEKTTHEDRLADALANTAELYALFSLCRSRGIDPFGEEMDARVDTAVREMIDSFDTRREYIASLAAMHMTDNACRIMLRSYLCEARLMESDMQEAMKEEIPTFCESENVVRVMALAVYYQNASLRDWAEARADEIAGMLALAPNTDAAFEEIAGREASFESHNYMTLDQLRELMGADADFTPAQGYISEPLFDSTSFVILRVADKDLSYIASHTDEIMPAYIDYLISEATVTDLTPLFSLSERDFA